MIAYEELEKALARWKSRRPGAGGAPEVRTEVAADDAIPSGVEYGETPAGTAPVGESDSSGEMELVADSAIVDES
ncbi:MAG TPA: hypothetical protein VHU40_07205 [Polyangia bacterium]|jgi:hypothetical protein|nr:hypothetical protein [Polyangia bacterium]